MSASFSGSARSRKILTVRELTGDIRELLESSFCDFWVEGEISDPAMPRSGHIYFTLKDRGAKIRGVIFKSHRRFLRSIPKEGESVLIRAHLSLYEPRGEYQLICDYIEPKGVGALLIAFETLKQKLSDLGLFSEGRKRKIPSKLSRIGIITSPSGAAIRDILKVIQERRFACEILISPVVVQGKHSASEMTDALKRLNQYSQKKSANVLDLLILTRGGGSLEDLSPFNDESLALAIFRSKIPVLSAIGHETDTTISDYVADLRAPTPSIAAEMVAQNGLASLENVLALRTALQSQIQRCLDDKRRRIDLALRVLVPPRSRIEFLVEQTKHLGIRLHQAMDQIIQAEKNRVQVVNQLLDHVSPTARIHRLMEKREGLHLHLIQGARRAIDREKKRLQLKMEQLDLLSPLSILSRGYSITRLLPMLDVVRSVGEVSVGDRLQVLLSDGHLDCKVEEDTPPLINRGRV